MKCIIPGPNVKVLARAIHSLAKMGDDLYLEFSSKDLSLRTTNHSTTAFAGFSFALDFFSALNTTTQDSQRERCQISVRSCLAVFRSPIALDRLVESLEVHFNQNSDKLIFLMKFKKGFIRTYHVPIIDNQGLEAYYLKDKRPNKLTFQPKHFSEILSNFQGTFPEVTWKAAHDHLIVQNYLEGEPECSGVRTELKIEKIEFDEYNISSEIHLTFCVKEVRAVLLFSDSVGLPVTAYFAPLTKPIIFSVKGEAFEADFVVSTLVTNDSSQSSDVPQKLSRVDIVNKKTIAAQVETHIDKEKSQNSQNSERSPNIKQLLAEMDNEPMEMEGLNGIEPVEDLNGGVHVENDATGSNRAKLKHIFRRCFVKDTGEIGDKLSGGNVILASDSDTE